jgi:hypothetical protein
VRVLMALCNVRTDDDMVHVNHLNSFGHQYDTCTPLGEYMYLPSFSQDAAFENTCCGWTRQDGQDRQDKCRLGQNCPSVQIQYKPSLLGLY